MNDECVLSLDDAVIAEAVRGELPEAELARVRGHLATCARCASTARSLERLKLVWTDVMDEVPMVSRTRDLRAMGRFVERAAGARRRGFAGGLAVGLAAAAALTLVVMVRRPPSPVAAGSAPGSAAIVVAGNGPPAVVDAASSAQGSRVQVASGLVVRAACTACRAPGGEVAAGAVLGARESVTVPAGAELRLAFSFADAVADADNGVSVEGPAVVGSGSGSVVLEHGRARILAPSHASVVTPQVLATSKVARWSIESSAHGTHIEVLSGEVVVASRSGAPMASLAAGESLVVDEHGVLVRSSAGLPARPGDTRAERSSEPRSWTVVAQARGSAAPAPPLDHWQAAREALGRGDRATAEAELRELLAGQPDAPNVPRATFMLAELELARGAVTSARLRLRELLGNRDAQLAEDSASLLVRSYRTPEERARIWWSYLATEPPSPRRERAMLERVRALEAAGRHDEASHVTARLCAAWGAEELCQAARDAATSR